MKAGKLPHALLAEMLGRLPKGDSRVIVGPGVGEDAAVVEVGERFLVVTSDPITFATDLIGWYAVQVNANDVAVMGADPKWFLGTLLLPLGATEADIGLAFDQVVEVCRSLDITLIGGHTEVTPSVHRPVLIGCMLGETTRERLTTSAGAAVGDAVVLSGCAAVEGTAILARDAAGILAARGIEEDSTARAQDFLMTPGISVVRVARVASEIGVSAMHDPTEGGIATGLLELALASEVGLEIDGDEIEIDPLTVRICDAVGIDPLGLIASGALLATVVPEKVEDLLSALEDEGRPARVIGRVVPKDEGLTLSSGGIRAALPVFERDEIARFFEEHTETD